MLQSPPLHRLEKALPLISLAIVMALLTVKLSLLFTPTIGSALAASGSLLLWMIGSSYHRGKTFGANQGRSLQFQNNLLQFIRLSLQFLSTKISQAHPYPTQTQPRLTKGGKKRYQRIWRFLSTSVVTLIFTVNATGITPWLTPSALASPSLTITPITWGSIGLDSNNVNVGPNQYVAGARVCNIGTSAATNVTATFVRDGAVNPYINIDGATTLSVASLPAGSLPPSQYTINYTPSNCFDFYYNITVTRTAAAYNTTQRFHIEAKADGVGVVSTPIPRELYVEKILSQARNSVISFTGPTTVYVGGVYDFTVVGKTATAYPQLVFSANFPNTVFQILKARTTYSNPSGGVNSTVYADACGWVSNPTSPDYRRSATTCNLPDNYPSGAAGNNVTTVYTVKILSPGYAVVNNLIFDFSGGSYHYNADYGTGVNIAITAVNPPSTDLQITKTHTGNFTVGQTGIYNITVSNPSSVAAEGPITVVDTLPAGLTYSSFSGSGWTLSSQNGQTLTFTNPTNIAPGGSSTFSISVNVGASAASNVNNTATVSSNTPDSNSANNTASDPTTILPSANLSITKSHTGNFTVGQNGTYTLTVANAGPSPSGAITVTDTLPAGLTYVSASGGGFTCSASGQAITCSNATGLAVGANAIITLTVGVAAAAVPSITNTATVAGTVSDPNTSNNTASDPTTVNPVADLSITKTAGSSSFTQGATGTYTLTITNSGPSAAAGPITVTDVLPTGLSFVSGEGTGWNCLASGQTVTCTNPNGLAASSSSTITLTVGVSSTAPASVNNQATISSPTSDPNTGNNTSNTTTTSIVAPPSSNGVNLAVTKTHSPTTGLKRGDAVIYTVTVLNKTNSNNMTNNFSVTDLLPTGVSITSTAAEISNCQLINSGGNAPTCGTATISGQTISITGVNSKRGDSVIYTIKGTIAPTATDALVNRVEVFPPTNTTDVDPSDNKAVDPIVLSSPDLTVTKTANGTFQVGSNGTYTITVQNVGTVTTTGTITIQDTLPAGMTYVSASGTGWSCPVAPATSPINCSSTTALASGASSSITLTVKPTSAGSNVINSVTVSGGGDTNSANNSASVGVNVIAPSADLSITKTPTGSFALGQTGTYTITVTNPSSSNTSAGPVQVTDTLPTGLSFISGIGSGWVCSASGQNVTCTNSNGVTPGTSSAITLYVAVGSNTPLSFNNTATVASLNSSVVDPTSNNTAIAPTIVTPSADLGITKSHTGNFTVGQNSNYTITVTNNGPSAASNASIQDTLPNGLSYVSATGSNWTCSFDSATRKVTCNYSGSMVVGTSSSIILMVTPTVSGTLVNTVSVSSTTTDSNSNNNSANDSTVVDAATADLVLTKTHFGSFTIGEEGTYSLTVKNNGPSAVVGAIQIVDTLPTGLSFVGFIGAGWSCIASGQTVTCTNANSSGLALNASSTVDLRVLVGPEVGIGTNTVINTASATSPTPDPNSANNTNVKDSTTILAGADLSLVKAAVGEFKVGQNATYSITISNAGPTAANGSITVTDTLPNGLSFVEGVGTDWLCSASGQTVSCTNGDGLVSGGNTVLTLSVQVGSAASPNVTNTAQVTSPTFDPNSANNTGSVNTPMTNGASPPKLLLVKRITSINGTAIASVVDDSSSTDDNASGWPTPKDSNSGISTYLRGVIDGGVVRPGDQVEYTIYFLSNSSIPVTNASLCDLVPANSTFIPNAFSSLSGIELSISNTVSQLTNVPDMDSGKFFAPNITPSVNCSAANTNGAVVVKIVQSPATLPASPTSPGYGFVRFRARMN